MWVASYTTEPCWFDLDTSCQAIYSACFVMDTLELTAIASMSIFTSLKGAMAECKHSILISPGLDNHGLQIVLWLAPHGATDRTCGPIWNSGMCLAVICTICWPISTLPSLATLLSAEMYPFQQRYTKSPQGVLHYYVVLWLDGYSITVWCSTLCTPQSQ